MSRRLPFILVSVFAHAACAWNSPELPGAQKISKPVQWEVACATTEKGWTVEMRIELSSLGLVADRHKLPPARQVRPSDLWALAC